MACLVLFTAVMLVVPANLVHAGSSSIFPSSSECAASPSKLAEINPALLLQEELVVEKANEVLSLLQSHVIATKANTVERSNFQSFCGDRDGFVSEWSDEFEGEKLDTNVWKLIGSDGRSEGPQTSVVAGLETTACRTASCREKNVVVQNGKLYLTSEKDAVSKEYFTGAVTTKGRKTWSDSTAYRMCISAKLPGKPGKQGQGVWPAHWMLPDNGISDECLDEGEMDIMEMVNSDGGAYSTFHWMSSWPHQKCASFDQYHKSAHSLTRMPVDWNSEFHEYAVERSQGHIAFAVDGRVVLNVSAADANTELSHTPFFLILNTAIGGGWPGEPTEETQLPVEHVIDYVRVSRRKSPSGNVSKDRPPEPSSRGSGGLSFTQISSEVHANPAQGESRSIPHPPLSLRHHPGWRSAAIS